MSGSGWCVNCEHSWGWHCSYDDEKDRYEPHQCNYWEGCDCTDYKEENTHERS